MYGYQYIEIYFSISGEKSTLVPVLVCRSKFYELVTFTFVFRDPLLHCSTNAAFVFVVGVTGVGSPRVNYPQLEFKPSNFFALGSPAAMFLTVRGVDSLGEEFHLPTCPRFFNIFHPVSLMALILCNTLTLYSIYQPCCCSNL